MDPMARAVLYGLGLGHSKKHIARATIEGIAFAMRYCIDIAEKTAGVRASHFKVFGGGSTIPLMVEILANVLSRRLEVTANEELGALGLASIITQSNGGHDKFPEYGPPTSIAATIEPNSDLAHKYEVLYSRYKEIEEGMSKVNRSAS